MSIRGEIYPVSGRVVQGWVVFGGAASQNDSGRDLERTGEFAVAPVIVTLLANGAQVGEGVASEPAGEAGAIGFTIALDRRFSREGDVRFEVQLEGRTFAVRYENFGQGLSDLFAGQVEEMTEGVIRGWAINLGPGETPVTINVFVGSLWLGATVTDRVRGDVRRRFGLQGLAGFSFPIPFPFRGAEPRVFRLFYANTAIEMEGSPLVSPEVRTGPSAEALAALLS